MNIVLPSVIKTVKASEAKSGHIYLYCGNHYLIVTPCDSVDRAMNNVGRRGVIHALNLGELSHEKRSAWGALLDPNTELIYVGEPTIELK